MNCVAGAPAKVNAWARYGCGNSNWIHVSVAPSGMASSVVSPKSPSVRSAASTSPDAVVMRGFASAMRTSSSGTRYASTRVSA
jgi:hypothetical protein